jgi:spore germination cell wall hydrolase CwlJ-like protein
VAPRTRSAGAYALLFLLGGACAVLVPKAIGYRDFGYRDVLALKASAKTAAGGETATSKTEVSAFKSPAERLRLTGKTRAKAEKCLADAIYFEARGEPLRGQMAVAQVVMNRVFSGRYPRNVCGVVYQNASHYLACQFTFACEGKNLSRIDEPRMWRQAQRIAADELDGKIWLTEVGRATHYHASWVRPYWVRQMAKLYRLGVHTFYRPRAWGNRSDPPRWTAASVPPKTIPASAPVGEAPAAANKSPDAMTKAPEATAVEKTQATGL